MRPEQESEDLVLVVFIAYFAISLASAYWLYPHNALAYVWFGSAFVAGAVIGRWSWPIHIGLLLSWVLAVYIASELQVRDPSHEETVIVALLSGIWLLLFGLYALGALASRKVHRWRSGHGTAD